MKPEASGERERNAGSGGPQEGFQPPRRPQSASSRGVWGPKLPNVRAQPAFSADILTYLCLLEPGAPPHANRKES